MMEIKFRAWNKEQSAMFTWDQLLSIRYGHAKDNIWNDPGLILLQFTCLHDKNGKEIYKGDLLKSEGELVYWDGRPTGTPYKHYFEVIQMAGYFTTRQINNNLINKFAPSQEIWGKYYEVIGNIYQNPELLEAKNG